MTKGELEEVYRRLCVDIQAKTAIYERVSNELDKLHADAEQLEYQIANYGDDDDEQAEGRES